MGPRGEWEEEVVYLPRVRKKVHHQYGGQTFAATPVIQMASKA